MPDTLGFIGSGMIGLAVARLAVAAGLDVVLSNSRGPETLAGLVAELGPRARAATPAKAARTSDLVVAAIPLHAFDRLPARELAGKTVLDTANYYPERDGGIAALDAGELTSTALVQRHLADAHVVKAFNTITPHQIVSLARPSGAPDRSALPVAGDDPKATAEAAELLDVLGFDAVRVGNLGESWRTEPDTPAYVRPYLGDVPPVDVEEFLLWTTRTPGVVVPAPQVAALVAAAVRRVASAARLPSADA
ncbi:NADPH-dependent F420 reductase [Yinghuangia soli]|uniref:NAD(P)-binding domain-containing protein n=1 Tax=Yinghuangia soli TaxID=2908204 RepID=A0AA41PZ86_9ACTN|nr:NAD(P)-binding domain-containing protein [Yinghuangia soli]MCF2527856.1 NAD(P)-binding domain-containing protein [Yinghuangia soli]